MNDTSSLPTPAIRTPGISTLINVRKLPITGVWFRSIHDNIPRPFQSTLDFLGERHALNDDKFAAAGFSLVTYTPGATRGNEGVTHVNALVLDYDHLARAELEKLCAHLRGYAFVAYSTFSHLANGDDDHCLRVVLPLSRPVTPGEHVLIRAELIAEVGVAADARAEDVSRLWLMPTCPASRANLAFLHYADGGLVEPEPFLVIARASQAEAISRGRSPMAPAPHTIGAMSMERIRERLGKIKSEDTRHLLQPVLDGQPFAQMGARDDTCWRILCTLAFLAPDANAALLTELMQPSIEAMAALEPEGALTLAQVREKATRALEQAISQGARIFERGDEVELAQVLLAGLEVSSPVVFDRAAFHRYQPKMGIWEMLPSASLSNRVQALAGKPVLGGESMRPLRIDSRTVKGALALAADRVARPGFFSDPARGVVFSNGFVQVTETGLLLLPHSPEHRALHRLPFAYSPLAPRPLFERFLSDIFQGDVDAEQKRAILQEFVGACLVGIATRYAKALVLVGGGRNGKSTFLGIIEALLPVEARASISPQSFENEYYRAAFEGVLLNSVSELPRADILRGEAFKAIIAGDRIMGRAIREAPREVVPRAGHLFAANTLPGVDDTSSAFWERLLVVTFNRTFAEHERDKTLKERIIATELGGVAAWALEGALRLMQRGIQGRYTEPASHAQALSEWRSRTDQVAQFLEEETLPITTLQQRTSGSALYGAYREWADKNGHRILSNSSFVDRVKARGIRSVKPDAQRLYEVMLRSTTSANLTRTSSFFRSAPSGFASTGHAAGHPPVDPPGTLSGADPKGWNG